MRLWLQNTESECVEGSDLMLHFIAGFGIVLLLQGMLYGLYKYLDYKFWDRYSG